MRPCPLTAGSVAFTSGPNEVFGTLHPTQAGWVSLPEPRGTLDKLGSVVEGHSGPLNRQAPTVRSGC